MGTLFNPLVGDLQQVLTLRLKQHGLGASNLANANVPGYRAKHVDFDAALSSIFDGNGPAMTSGDVPVETIDPHPLAEDGNSVNAEDEMMKLTANNLQFNATVEVLTRQLAMLEYAANDGR